LLKSTEELAAYERAEKARNDYLSSLEQKFDEGVVKGKAEERAIAELEKAANLRNMARAMHKQGIDIPTICLITQLTAAEIEAL